MHVEVSVAVNFFISYLYNKLPRRRVDLFGEELEKGLKQKFEGHWYPDKPFKGSGFRCIRCNGEKVDAVISDSAKFTGLDLNEIKEYVPEELTMWIDPSEVSYRLNEKSPIKILYTDRHDEDGCGSADREVQIHTFNPEALSFQPIDSLSSSLSSLSLSPSSPAPPTGAWNTSVSPSASLFSSRLSSAGAAHHASFAGSPVSAASVASAAAAAGAGAAPVLMGRAHNNPQFTAATFAQTKFGSTKLKTQAKRPTRLSPTEMGNYFRQQQQRAAGFVAPALSPQRPRSLSPRDPRLEFLLDQQQRFYQRGQLSPQNQQSVAQALQQKQQQQQLQQQQPQQQQQQQQFGLHQYHHQQPPKQATFPPCSSAQGPVSPGNGYAANPPGHFGHTYAKSSHGGGPTPWSFGGNDPWSASRRSASPHLSPSSAYPDFFPSATPAYSPHAASSGAGLLSPPESHKSFLEELQQLSNVHNAYPSGLQHMLVAN